MATAAVNPDLARVRAQATFDPLQLTYFLYDGPEKTKRKRFLQNMATKEHKEQNFRRFAELSREEQYEEALRKTTYTHRRIAELGLKDQTDIFIFREVISPSEPNPFGLHEVMFVTTIEKQGTKEQREKWLPLAKRFGVIGTYAQTELGHGTFLRGLETTATYDPKTKEFVVNSPTVSAAKYWPGGLGKTANCCVVMAKLITNGQNYGMQSFLVQIRDFETHQPLPGVSVGDIGQKFGYGAMDNGFLILNNVRIPRENMLMRYAQVLEDGTFVSPKNDRLVYGSMTLIRSQIVGGCARSLAKAVTIATRYSAVRRQSEINTGQGEVQVLDFQTQQHRLFTQIASSYALTIAGRVSTTSYIKVNAQIESGNLDDMPILHALSAALKAFSSWEMMSGIEQCRLACGGHGYSLASGLPKIYVNEVPACTYEGENVVLCLQTARFLVKCYNAAEKGQQLPSMVSFLRTAKGGKSRLTEKLELDQIIAAYEHRAARQLEEANTRLQNYLNKGTKPADAWNSSSQSLVEAAVAFTHAFVVKAFIEKVTTSRLEPSLSAVLIQLCQLYALHGISSNAGQFLRGGYLSDEQLTLVENKTYELLAALRPNSVALVDAFDFPDLVLDSDLGRYDGNVYEALMEYARRSKLNQTEVHEGFYKYQKPFVESLKAQVAAQSRL
uniref:Acyl-coenzyme A oxidase n=1 Tax=Arion vulgaris TaxID=1028688 RepID=A0A0B6ZLF2_9EUPU